MSLLVWPVALFIPRCSLSDKNGKQQLYWLLISHPVAQKLAFFSLLMYLYFNISKHGNLIHRCASTYCVKLIFRLTHKKWKVHAFCRSSNRTVLERIGLDRYSEVLSIWSCWTLVYKYSTWPLFTAMIKANCFFKNVPINMACILHCLCCACTWTICHWANDGVFHNTQE